MKSILIFCLIITGIFMFSTPGKNQGTTGSVKTPGIAGSGPLSLFFIPNKGQVNQQVKFYARTSKYTLWLTPQGMVFDSIQKVAPSSPRAGQSPTPTDSYSPYPSCIHASMHPCISLLSPRTGQSPVPTDSPYSPKSTHFLRDVSRLSFLDARPAPEIIPLEEPGLKVNYFKGNDPSQWICDIPAASAVLYREVYDRVDLKVYGLDKQVEYDWRIKPGGRPETIRFKYEDVEESRLDSQGNIRIKTRGGEFIHMKPVCFQVIGDTAGSTAATGAGRVARKQVTATFREIGPHTFGFTVGDYDKNAELVIDPVVMAYSTYLGGNGWEESYSVAVDSQGCAYVGGSTWSTDFPVRGQYQSDPGSENYDVFVTKIDPSKKGDASLVYSTYLGGTDSDGGSAIAVDNHGYVYVTGQTWSANFPVKNAYQDHLEVPEETEEEVNSDAFVVKLDPSRSGASSLLYSTYLGGIGEDKGQGIAADNNGNAYVVGWTYSTDFPLRNPFQSEPDGEYTEGFVTHLDTTKSGSAGLVYSTYLGGKGSEGCTAAAADGSGDVYVTGWTYSSDFPVKNPYQSHKGFSDAFVARLDTANSGAAGLLFSTYLGGGQADYGFDIDVDANNPGFAYITGLTRSTNFPTKNSFQKDQSGDDAFVAALDTAKSGSSCLVYSTYLGGSGDDRGYGLAADPGNRGYVYVTGVTGSSNFPSLNPYQSNQGEEDAFVTQLDTLRAGTAGLLFSTYLGGNKADSGLGIAADADGNIYVTGWTLSTDFPSLNRYQGDKGDNNYDSFLTRFFVEPDEPPSMVISRDAFDFRAVEGGACTGPQTFLIGNSGAGHLNWTAAASAAWIAVDPAGSASDALVSVSVVPTGLAAGSYTGTITISDPEADNSPQTVTVNLTVYSAGSTTPPFGQFSTPIDGSLVSSSVPVTGWALDDLGVVSVKIYLGDTPPLAYIGDTVFIEGARPDIETSYPGYPMNYRAGWGYMLLTNFLPDGGNGTYTIHALAVDVEGQEVSLGSVSIIADNAHAVKPFGAIDTPLQGGTVSGSSFKNVGWVLTPQPNTIPTDGSTIAVWVDGVNLGHPSYNNYRPDIAQLFPGYNNSNGAAGYFTFDTTNYTNGIHTILWTAADNAGNADGIGSRYFSILNFGSSPGSASRSCQNPQSIPLPENPGFPLYILKGFDKNSEPREVSPGENGWITVETKALERMEFRLFESTGGLSDWTGCSGFQVIAGKYRPLPVGSFLDKEKGVFYWQPGVGFIGQYRLVFLMKNHAGQWFERKITIIILP